MEWLSLVLGGGLVATIGAVFQGLKMLRDSTATRTARAVGDLERWREEADERTRGAREDGEWYQDLADYWRSRAGNAEYEARSGGVKLSKPPPVPERHTHRADDPAPPPEKTP